MGKASAQLPIGSNEWKIARCFEGSCPGATCIRKQCVQGLANLEQGNLANLPDIQPGGPGNGPPHL